MTVFTEQSDLEAVLTMLQSRTEVDRECIFLMGTSQGGMASAMTGAAHPSDIRGMILLYPAFCIPGDARAHYGGGEEIPDRVSFFSWMSVGRPYVEAVLDYDIYDVIPAYTRDVLLLHGDRDGIVDLSYSRQAVETYPSARLEVISGAGHGFSGERFDLAMEYIVEYINGHLNDEEL